jgi:hypothetical protein
MEEFLNEISALFIVLGTMFVKWFSDNIKKRKTEKKLTETDKVQNDKIESIINSVSEMKIKIDFLSENQKNYNFIEKLILTLQDEFRSISSQKKFTDTNILILFSESLKEIKIFAKEVLYRDFNLCNEKLDRMAKMGLNTLKQHRNIEIGEDFCDEIESRIIKPEIDKFILNFARYKKLENGERRKCFEIAIIELFQNILFGVIDLHNFRG